MEETETKPGRRKRLVIVSAAAVVMAVIVSIAFWPRPKEAEYQGKKLSEWLRALRNPESEDATNAVLAIGTNALPFLVKWVQYELPEWREGAANNTAKWPRWRISFWVAKHL